MRCVAWVCLWRSRARQLCGIWTKIQYEMPSLPGSRERTARKWSTTNHKETVNYIWSVFNCDMSILITYFIMRLSESLYICNMLWFIIFYTIIKKKITNKSNYYSKIKIVIPYINNVSSSIIEKFLFSSYVKPGKTFLWILESSIYYFFLYKSKVI